jgi:copper chaperone
MNTRILNAPDISCDHCERTIRKALASIPGVGQVKVDIPKREIRLDVDQNLVKWADIESILAREGYPVAPDAAPSQVKGEGSSCCGRCHI